MSKSVMIHQEQRPDPLNVGGFLITILASWERGRRVYFNDIQRERITMAAVYGQKIVPPKPSA